MNNNDPNTINFHKFEDVGKSYDLTRNAQQDAMVLGSINLSHIGSTD